MPPVGSHVKPLQELHRRFRSPPILHHPAGKFLNRLQIKIERLDAYAALYSLNLISVFVFFGYRFIQPQFRKVLLHLACGNIRPNDKFATLDYPLCPRHNKRNVVFCITTSRQSCLKVV
ncbi:MAG: hypothetical protein ABSB11_04850 [Sedimentisphaerales bacterium]